MNLERILHVELGERRCRAERLAPEDRRALGGAALGVALLERFLAAGTTHRRGSGSPWILSIGPLTGTPLAPRPQAVITHLSPLTGGVNDSVITHPVALALAASRTAAIVLTGRSEAPTWLRIRDGGLVFEDAAGVWGQDVARAARLLGQAAGAPGLVAGPAAERGVPYASLGSERHSAGRGGAGAALAALNVKGLAAHSSRPGGGGWAAPGKGADGGGGIDRSLRRLRLLHRRQALPTRNFRARSFPHTEKLARDLESWTSRANLPYEAIFAFGPLLGIAEGAVVRGAVAACDRLGLDLISAGGTIAWALEAAEAGMLQMPPVGSGEALERLLESVARREGPAELLALGSSAAGRRLGPPAEDWAMQVRGLEIPGYDPRSLPSLALGYAVGSRGACHVRSGAYELDLEDPLPDPPDAAEVARRAVLSEDRSTLLDSLVLDRSIRGGLGEPFEAAARLLSEAGEGALADPEALRQTVRGVACARRRINRSMGWTAEGDSLPRRLLEEDGGAPSLLSAPRLRDWVSAYYRLRGWSADGEPP